MKKHKIEVAKITTSGHKIELEIEGKISKKQKESLSCAMNNAHTTVYSDIRKFLSDSLKHSFDKVGFGGNHVWCSDEQNNRLAIIKIKDVTKKRV